jgi:hypothetical protein
LPDHVGLSDGTADRRASTPGQEHHGPTARAEGHSMKQVARKLSLSPRTVAYHKYGMMQELGLRTNAKLIQYAIQRELMPA